MPAARPASPHLVSVALADAASLGPFFNLTGDGAAGAWQPAATVYQHGLTALVQRTAAHLGVGEDRVAASTLQLSFAARLWSPLLASALSHGIVADSRGLLVSSYPPLRLRLPGPAGWHAGDEDTAAGLLVDAVVGQHLEPLSAGLTGMVASALLWGNATSALAGALGVIARARPLLAGRARALADRLLRTGRLHGAGTLTGPGLSFSRRSCCLYYRVPGGGLCADCPLPRVPGR